VFVEKPLDVRDPRFWPLLSDYASVIGVQTMVGSNWRYHPGPAHLKRWLGEGFIGEPISARFYAGYYLPKVKLNYQEAYTATTGVILDVGSHVVDLATWLLGPARLRSALWRSATSISLDCDGVAELLLEHESGVISSVGVSWLQRDSSQWIEIIGTDGTAIWNQEQESVWRHDAEGQQADSIILGWEDYRNQMYIHELRHFLDCVQSGKQSDNPIGDAVKTLEILLAAREGQWRV
jgi:predicted dehydrogenase